MARHLEIGEAGETWAARELERLGYRIIETNVNYGVGELDIVAEESGEIAVVEVRTRTIGRMLPPEATVGPRKTRKLVKAGSIWVDRNGWDGPWRIDIAAVTLSAAGEPKLEIFKDITLGSDWL
ncbi:MAG: YraN family protein [Synergistota bacterium]|nr:YraN family protein [Synergistota bacterium]